VIAGELNPLFSFGTPEAWYWPIYSVKHLWVHAPGHPFLFANSRVQIL
jgi:hypothetical protein